MKTRILTALGILCVAIVVASAQSSLAGKWTGEEKSGSGAVAVVLQLTVNGSAVSGTVTVGENPTQAIADPKIDGNRLSFKTITMMNGKEIAVSWDGEAKGDELPLTRTIGTSTRKLPPIVLKKSK